MEVKSETVLSHQPRDKGSGILRYSLYLFGFFLALGIGVYLYTRKLSTDLNREVTGMMEETDEQIEDKIKDMQKYLLHHPSE